MESVLEGGEHLERELTPEPIAGPAVGSVALHLLLVASVILYGFALGLFRHNIWGNPGAGGSIQVKLTTALPLPANEINNNVLATETPSEAPAPLSPKELQREDLTAIPIPGRHAKPARQNVAKTQPYQPKPQPDTAPSGEQAGSRMPQQMQPGPSGPTTVGDNSFASMYPWYVDQINRIMSQNWNKQQVDQRTPKGSRVYLTFTIHRDGTLSGLQLARSSGSPTLDNSCELAAQRVDTFGNLPSTYNQSTLKVSYYCEY